MAKLIERTVCDIVTVFDDDKVSIIEGEICSVGDKEGDLQIINPVSFKRIGRAKIGSDFDKDSCVFFSPNRAEIFKTEVSEKKKFKFGFSFERMEASSKTLQELNKPVRESEKNPLSINDNLLLILNGKYNKDKIEKQVDVLDINKIYEAKVVSVPYDNYKNKFRMKLSIKYRFGEHEVSVNFSDIIGKKMPIEEYKKLINKTVPVKIIKLSTFSSTNIGSIKETLI